MSELRGSSCFEEVFCTFAVPRWRCLVSALNQLHRQREAQQGSDLLSIPFAHLGSPPGRCAGGRCEARRTSNIPLVLSWSAIFEPQVCLLWVSTSTDFPSDSLLIRLYLFCQPALLRIANGWKMSAIKLYLHQRASTTLCLSSGDPLPVEL
jgi:hypothetical protein